MRRTEYPVVICTSDYYNDVVYAEFPTRLIVNIDIAREMVKNRLHFTAGQEHFVVIDLSNIRQVSAEAREFLQDPNGGMKNLLGAAFIAANPVSALIANIFIKLPKKFPSKFFYRKDEAFNWITILKNSSNQ